MTVRTLATLVIVLAAAQFALAPAIAAPPAPRATPTPSGLAYDEVVKIVQSSSAPPIGTFQADFQAAVDTATKMANAGEHHGLFGGIRNTIAMASNAMALMKNGFPSRHAFMLGWERDDDLGAQTATIYKWQQHQVIHLNLAKKTYRIEDTTQRMVTFTPPPYNNSPQGQKMMAPGTAKLDINLVSSGLGSQTIEGLQTNGYSESFTLAMSEATGSCENGSATAKMTEYLANFGIPHVAYPPSLTPPPPRMPTPSLMMARGGCKPAIAVHSSGMPPPSGRFSMYTWMTFSGKNSGMSLPEGAGFLMERGNVHTLTGNDRSLFEVPADFTKEQD